MANELANGLIHYFTMSNSGNSVSTPGVTVANAVVIAGGIRDNCYRFNGTNASLTLGTTTVPANMSNLNSGSSFSISIWVYPVTITGATGSYAGLAASAQRYGMSLRIPDGRIYFGLRSAAMSSQTKVSTTTVSLNTWTHLCIVQQTGSTSSSTLMYLYKNGVQVDSVITGTVTGSTAITAAFAVGRNNASVGGNIVYFSGRTDELAIWNRSLTSGEVNALYNNGLGYTYPLPTGYANKINRVLNSQIGKINGVSKYNISKINRK